VGRHSHCGGRTSGASVVILVVSFNFRFYLVLELVIITIYSILMMYLLFEKYVDSSRHFNVHSLDKKLYDVLTIINITALKLHTLVNHLSVDICKIWCAFFPFVYLEMRGYEDFSNVIFS